MRIGPVFTDLCFAVGLALAAMTPSQAQAPSAILIRGATIIDGLSDAPLRDRSLLIEGNTIRDTLPGNATAPSGVQVLDLTGKYIWAVRFPCALGRLHGRAFYQSRCDLDCRVGKYAEGIACEKPGCSRSSTVLPSRRPTAIA